MSYQNQYQQQQMQQQQQPTQSQTNVVSAEQYNYLMTNFRLAHEKVEQQRQQLEEQERQNSQLKARIALLEGNGLNQLGQSGSNKNTVDDFLIKTTASKLDKQINRFAADIVNPDRGLSIPLQDIATAVLQEMLPRSGESPFEGFLDRPRVVQSLLRHALSEVISEGFVKSLVVSNSLEANVQLTRIHEGLFARDPTIASVWRRQTFSVAIESCSTDLIQSILEEYAPNLLRVLSPQLLDPNGCMPVLQSAFEFSRMMHQTSSFVSSSNLNDVGPGRLGGAGAGAGGGSLSEAFYQSFVPEIGSPFHPQQVELITRCIRSDTGKEDWVGATVFPGLAKVTKAPGQAGREGEVAISQTVVRRAQVICQCALIGAVGR